MRKCRNYKNDAKSGIKEEKREETEGKGRYRGKTDAEGKRRYPQARQERKKGKGVDR